MATIDGKPLASLRVIDLKAELEKRGLPKSGAKKDLIERLSKHLIATTAAAGSSEDHDQGAAQAMGSPPNVNLAQNLCDNDIVQDYLRMRQTQFESALSGNEAAIQHQQQLEKEQQEAQNQAEEQKRLEEAQRAEEEQLRQERLKQEEEERIRKEQERLLQEQERQRQEQERQKQEQERKKQEELEKQKREELQRQELERQEKIKRQEELKKEEERKKKEEEDRKQKELEDERRRKAQEEEKLRQQQDKQQKLEELQKEEQRKKEQKRQEELKRQEETAGKEQAKEEEDRTTEVEKSPEDEVPETDEIIVATSPIDDGGDDTLKDSELCSATAPPPPEEVTFRKLSRTISNDKGGSKSKRGWGGRGKDDEGTITVSSKQLKDVIPDIKPYLEDMKEDKKEEEEQIIMEIETHDEVKEEPTNPLPLPLVEEDKRKAKSKDTMPENTNKSSVISIRNLVRPFTIIQLTELLARTGKISEDGFWIDKIKSHAIVEYSCSDEAEETLMALDGVKWPSVNPKTLSVTFTTKSVLEQAKSGNVVPQAPNNRSKTQDRSRPEEPAVRKRKHSGAEEKISTKQPRHDPKVEEDNQPKQSLDDLFCKTKTAPCIYWLPKVPLDKKQ